MSAAPDDPDPIRIAFETEVIEWRGPAPFFYAPAPPDVAAELRAVMRAVTYGWGMIPVEAQANGVAFTTALFPKDDTYLLPLKAAVRRQAAITAGDHVAVQLTLAARRG
ncbi:DUF1905 domain-containing protein [Caulobacter sp. KR2-114]|uniref:DUF1905 domain-containing protein n=1 Tax=Caulobacter sp. KR2-114 TaxID=3400912 RepID=UPI003C11CC23